jgi:NAD(P)H-hydrate epimerase
MKIFTNHQMREIDARTQAEYGIPERALMEEAGKAVARVAQEKFATQRVLVVTGKGNNAGDGYVAARYLRYAGIAVKIVAVARPESLKGVAAEMFREAREAGIPIFAMEELGALLEESDLVVDALCGTGIRGPLEGEFAEAAQRISKSSVPVLSVDVPSGVRELGPGEELGTAVEADLTVAIGAPKICTILLPGSLYTGELVVERINFPAQLLDSEEWPFNIAAPQELRAWIPSRPLTANKGTFGKVGIVAGSAPYLGAAILAARGALRAGAGLVYVFTTDQLNPILKAALPEAVTVIAPSRDPHWLDELSFESIREKAVGLDVLAVGMGLGTAVSQQELVRAIISELSLPIVLDADALAALAALGLPALRTNIVMTPHPGEMARLLRTSVSAVQRDRIEAARSASGQAQTVVLLKGADTIVARPDGQVWINPGACPALAKGGTGDVLSGVIAALIGQGLEPWQAAVLGARLHLEAGRECAESRGEWGVLAHEVADEVPRIMAQWQS